MTFYRARLKTVDIPSSMEGTYERTFGKYVCKSVINSCPLLLTVVLTHLPLGPLKG